MVLLNFQNKWVDISATVSPPGATLVAAPGVGKVLVLRSLEFSDGGVSPIQVSARFGDGTLVSDEVCTIASSNIAHTLANLPARQFSVSSVAIDFDADSSCVLADDGAGALEFVSGDAPTITSATINYSTGALAVNFVENITAATVTYRYDIDKLLGISQIGVNYRSKLPPEGLVISPDGTTNHQLYVAVSATCRCNAIYMAVER